MPAINALVQPLPIGPLSSLDLAWDWTQWLATGDTIASFTVVGSDGLGLSSVQQLAGTQIIVAWAAPTGDPEDGTAYSVTCTVTTASTPPRIDSRTIELIVQSR
jgi:hypothetical protein